jgi:hypothetical protein
MAVLLELADGCWSTGLAPYKVAEVLMTALRELADAGELETDWPPWVELVEDGEGELTDAAVTTVDCATSEGRA